MPRLILAILGVFLNHCGKRFPECLQKLPGCILFLFCLGWWIIEARQVNRLAAIALDADACDTVTLALHRQMWLAILL
jgi:hypothetical protein